MKAAGKHRRREPRTGGEALEPLLRRAVGAAALWLAVFALVSLAVGWTLAAAVALAGGVACVLGLSLGHVISTAKHSPRDPLATSRRG